MNAISRTALVSGRLDPCGKPAGRREEIDDDEMKRREGSKEPMEHCTAVTSRGASTLYSTHNGGTERMDMDGHCTAQRPVQPVSMEEKEIGKTGEALPRHIAQDHCTNTTKKGK
jgi:hypothetical protein